MNVKAKKRQDSWMAKPRHPRSGKTAISWFFGGNFPTSYQGGK